MKWSSLALPCHARGSVSTLNESCRVTNSRAPWERPSSDDHVAARRSQSARPSSPCLAEAQLATRQWELLYSRSTARAAVGDGLRERSVSEPAGVLCPADGDLHDPRQRLHAPLRLLCGRAWRASPGRSRRTG